MVTYTFRVKKKGSQRKTEWEKETDAEQPKGGEKIQEDDGRSHWKKQLLWPKVA